MLSPSDPGFTYFEYPGPFGWALVIWQIFSNDRWACDVLDP